MDPNEADGKPGEPRVPPKYSQALHREIVSAVMRGNDPAVAASAAGLPKNEFYRWKRMTTDGNAHPVVVQLFEDIDRAFDVAEVMAFEDVRSDEKNRGENAKWFLERKRAKDYSKREITIIKAEFDAVFDRLEVEFGSDPRLLERIYRVIAGEIGPATTAEETAQTGK